MSSFDVLLINSLREIGINIPETIQSVEEIDRVFFFNICIQCLSLLNHDILNTISFAEDDMDLTHSNCNVLATILRTMGCTYEIRFNTLLYPNPDDMAGILAWLMSTISSTSEQSQKKSSEYGWIDGDTIRNALYQWKQHTSSSPSTTISSGSNALQSILDAEEDQLIHEQRRFEWREIPSIGINAILENELARSHVQFHRIHFSSSSLFQNDLINEEVSALQRELLKINRIFYKRLYTVKGLTQKVQQLKCNVEEMRKVVETSQLSLFQKQQSSIDIRVVDEYLAQIHANCDTISAERTNTQLIFQHDREHIIQVIDELEQCKHVLWEQTQSLLSHVQNQRQEIESITSVLTEKRREKDELSEMLRAMPKQSFREGYIDRLSQLSAYKINQKENISAAAARIKQLHQTTKELSQAIETVELDIEKDIQRVYGTEVENSTLHYYYSQIKRLFHSLISILYRLMETDDKISSIHIQINKIDLPVICSNYELLLGDVEKLRKENDLIMKRIRKLEEEQHP